jgi:membrane fusion protein (multidrug efflux system)
MATRCSTGRSPGKKSPVQRLPLLLLVTGFALLCAACGKQEAAPGPGPEVVVAPVEKQDVEIYSEWVGTTAGYVNAEILPKIQGYLLKQAYQDGSLVKEGDLLFEIDPRQFQASLDEASGQLARARAAFVKYETDVTRYGPLAAQGAVSQQELDNAVQARAGSAAQVDSMRASVQQARLNLQWTQVKSPITGVAAIAKAQVGDLVSPQTPLTTVSQLDPIKVKVQVSEIEYLRFATRRADQQASDQASTPAVLQLILADGSTYPEPGRFRVAGLAVATTTGTIEIQGEFPNPNNLLRPGQFAKVRAVTDRRKDALLVPQRAVRDLQGMSQVAVVGADDKVAFKTVKLGPSHGSDVVVDSGLAAGERVVVEGLQKIREGMLVAPVTAAAKAAETPASPNAESGH